MGTVPVQGDGIALGDPFTPGFWNTLLSSHITFSWGSEVHRVESSFSSPNFGMRLIYEISTIALLWCCA